MKVWVLTGDKKETAINVGYASGLLNDGMEILHLKGKSEVRKTMVGLPDDTTTSIDIAINE